MRGPIQLYVSSSSELSAEREAIGQIVAGLPVTLGWQINHTPLPGSVDGGLGFVELGARVAACDLYSLILGQDFDAPMGFELRSFLETSRRPLGAYRKECNRSPSAQDAVRTLDVSWQSFSSLTGFSTRFRRDLLRGLLEAGPALGLDLTDVEQLLKGQEPEGLEGSRDSGDASRQGGADRSGRILGREVWQVEEQS